MGKKNILLGLLLSLCITGFGQSVNKKTEPIHIGGADIYLQVSKGLFAKHKAIKALKYHREGNTNVIVYKGMTVKYPDRTMVKWGQSTLPAKIYTYEGRTEFVLNGAVVTGSEGSDNVVVYCTNSTFVFEGGDTDTVCLTKKSAWDIDDPQMLGNTAHIGEGDLLINNIDYIYNGELVMSDTEYWTMENGELINEDGSYKFWNLGALESKTVRIKNRELSLDEDEWEED